MCEMNMSNTFLGTASERSASDIALWLCAYKFLKFNIYAGVAELADALDLGSSVNRCAGSSPVTRTKKLQTFYLKGFGAFHLVKILIRDFSKIYLCLTICLTHKNSYQFGNCFYVFNLSAILFTIFCLDLNSR